jgi:hypothetical protein
MELPTDVLVHNEQLGIKGGKGRLLQIGASGYYEVNLGFGDRTHRVLLPVAQTVLIAAEPEEAAAGGLEIER